MIIDDHIGDIKTRLISSGPHRVRPIGDTQGENGHGDAEVLGCLNTVDLFENKGAPNLQVEYDMTYLINAQYASGHHPSSARRSPSRHQATS